MAAAHYRHPAAVITDPRMADVTWVQGRKMVVMPAWDEREIAYVVPMIDVPLLEPARDLLESLACSKQEYMNETGEAVVALYRICRPFAEEGDRPALATFADELILWDIDVAPSTERGGRLRVGICWEVLKTVDAARHFAVHLMDAQGLRWTQVDELGYLPPEWQPGDRVWQWFELRVSPKIPPGTYQVRVILSDEHANAMPVRSIEGELLGTYVEAGPAKLEADQRWMEELKGQALSRAVHIAGWSTIDTRHSPGDRVLSEVTWQLAEPVLEPVQARFILYGEDQRIATDWEFPLAIEYPIAQWQPGETVRQRYLLRLPPELPEGRYAMRLSVTGGEEELSLGWVQVEGVARTMEPPPMQHPLSGALLLSGKASLLGYDMSTGSLDGDEPLNLTLYWQALSTIETDYRVFVHVLDAHGDIVAQRDVAPADDTRPTTGWIEGEVVADGHSLIPDGGWAPGIYRIATGMYDPVTLVRLEMLSPTGERVLDDLYVLGEFQVR